jgi:hypothetical protein
MAIKPTGEVVELAQVVQSEPPPALAAAPALVAENRLPDTASSLPFVALCGLLALIGAFGVRVASKRIL